MWSIQNVIVYKTPGDKYVIYAEMRTRREARVWSLLCPAAIDLFYREVISK